MALYIGDSFLIQPRDALLNLYLMDELEVQLKAIIPSWVQWVITKWPYKFLAQLLTGIDVKLITNIDEPGKITIEVWKNSVFRTDIVYMKETYITTIEPKANKNKNKDDIAKLENMTS